MAIHKEVDVHVPSALRQRHACMTVKFNLKGKWRIRLGMLFVRLGCWFIGTRLRVEKPAAEE